MPSNLKYIKFGVYYNKIITENVLPKSVSFIEFYGSKYNLITINSLSYFDKELIFDNLHIDIWNLPIFITKIKN